MKYMKRKVITGIICLLLIIVINFLLPRMMPGDPVLMLTGQDEDAVSAEKYEAYRAKLGLDDPLIVQFGRYIRGLALGDLGYSYHYNTTVSELIGERAPNTLQIAQPAIIISALLAVLFGCTAGYKENSKTDHGLSTGFILLNAVPTFLLSMLLLTALAFKLRLFPLGGLNSIVIPNGRIGFLGDRLWHLVLPVLTVTLAGLSGKYLLVRNTVASATKDKYVVYAKARGLSERRIKFIHILKNICPPFLTIVGLNLGFMISGSLIVEVIFSINGMGSLIYEAATFRDFPTLQGCSFYCVACCYCDEYHNGYRLYLSRSKAKIRWACL